VTSIRAGELPGGALLGAYRGGGAYADCFIVDVPRHVTQAEYVNAFYTTALFKVERTLLAWFAARPSSDAQARALADGTSNAFAAWTVEGREADQLLLRDFLGRTRSWLMSAPSGPGAPRATRLYFGSAVVSAGRGRTGRARMGWAFHALLGFHKMYSRALLRAAVRRLG
jgi:hypothetical protein